MTPLATTEAAVLDRFAETFPLAGTSVLEIGGAMPPHAVRRLGVKRWVALDPRNTESSADGSYVALSERAESSRLPDASFDYAISSNALHLMTPLDEVLSNVERLLRPGGSLFAEFGPIWSAPDGHQIEQVFGSGRELVFWRDFVVPHWWHLLFDANELAAILRTRLDAALADAVVHHVYFGGWVNRLFFEDYVQLFLDSELSLVRLECSQDLDYEPDFPSYEHPLLHDGRRVDVAATVRALHGGTVRDLLTRDLSVTLTKVPHLDECHREVVSDGIISSRGGPLTTEGRGF